MNVDIRLAVDCYNGKTISMSLQKQKGSSMSRLGINTEKTAAAKSIKSASIILIHFLSVIVCDTTKKANEQ